MKQQQDVDKGATTQQNNSELTPGNSWLDLVAKPAQPNGPPKPRQGQAFQRIYTYEHPAVSKARHLYLNKTKNLSAIARAVGVYPKTISRWLQKGLLTVHGSNDLK